MIHGKGKERTSLLLMMMISWCYKSSSCQLPVESFFRTVLVSKFFFFFSTLTRTKTFKEEKKSLTIIQKTASLDFGSKCMEEATTLFSFLFNFQVLLSNPISKNLHHHHRSKFQ